MPFCYRNFGGQNSLGSYGCRNGKSRTQGCYLDTSKFYDGSIFPTPIGTKPSFEYNFFDVHLLLALFHAFILLPFFTNIITSLHSNS